MRLLHSPGRIPLLSEMGLLVLLAWMVSGWLLPGEKIKSSGLMQESAGPAAVLPDLTGLLAIPLFGEAPVQVQPVKPVVKVAAPVVQSPLTLKLLGTIVAGEESAAIISISAGSDQSVFFIGDTIQPGVTLQEVEPWAVVVERAGVLERISLEQGAKLSATPMPVKMPAGNPAAASPAAMQRKMSRSQLQQQLGDLPALLSQARVIPNYTNGKPDGFVISEIVQGSLYQQAGLLNGDVILRVNGKQVTSAAQAMSMYQALQNAAAIDLELMRAGQMKQVHYDIR
jgi:general secretion pathway protein C